MMTLPYREELRTKMVMMALPLRVRGWEDKDVMMDLPSGGGEEDIMKTLP